MSDGGLIAQAPVQGKFTTAISGASVSIGGQIQINMPSNYPPGFIAPAYINLGNVIFDIPSGTWDAFFGTSGGVKKTTMFRCGDCQALVTTEASLEHTNWHARIFVVEDTLRLLRTGMTPHVSTNE